MTGTAIVTALIEILVSGLAGIGEAIGGALSTMAEAIFLTTEGISIFGILVAVFAAISLGLSLTRWVLNFVTSWGNRNR